MMPVLTRLQMILAAVATILVALVVFFVLIKPGWNRRAAAEAEASATVATGQANAAKDAGGVIINQADKEIDRAETDALNAAAIRAGNDPDAAMRAVCMRNSTYRRQPACLRLLGPDTGQLAADGRTGTAPGR
jgi:type II secretory pathway component PulM